MFWKSARLWGYDAYDAVSDIVLPKRHRVAQRSYTLVEIRRVLEAAEEPERTLYWLAAEAGMRGGELCGLQPLLVSLGINRGGLHPFRHGNIAIMDRLGVPLKVRMQRIGHSDLALTMGTYTHIESEDDVKFAEQLGGILRPNAPKWKEEGVAPGEQPLLN